MPSETTCRDYPYPLDTDLIDVATHLQDLAEAIDADICGNIGQIDTLQNEMANRVKKSGDSMSGGLVSKVGSTAVNITLQRTGDGPYIRWLANDGSPEFGYIQGAATYMRYAASPAASSHAWFIGGTERMKLSGAGLLQLDGNLTAGGAVIAGAYGSFGGNGMQVRVVDSSGGSVETPTAYVAFFRSGTVAAPTNRGAYVGFAGSTTLYMRNEVGNGGIHIGTITGNGSIGIATQGSGNIALASGTAGDIILDTGDDIIFQTNQITRGVMNGDRFIWGKSATDFAVAGYEVAASGGGEGAVWSTVAGSGSPNQALRRIGAASADNQYFVACYNAAGTNIGGLRMNGTTAVELAGTATSDYRVKEELGPLESVHERFMQLRPIRYYRTDDDDEVVHEGLVAHEVAELVPDAVSGEKDAVREDGSLDLQEMHGEKLVPLLIAKVQELVAEVAELQTQLIQMREDCCG